MYKTVAKKVKPVPGVFPQEALVRRTIPRDPLGSLSELPIQPPMFAPTPKITADRMESLEINKDGFLWPQEERLFQHIFTIHEDALAFEETDRGTLRESYFSPYVIPTVPHIPWECKNIPIPPGIRQKVIDLLRDKIKAGVYEQCQSAYKARWFCCTICKISIG
ncbi:hypothetical protein FA95DRAFT_1585415 [Auriscalpium vulgare]|uniref:Uncharacterized protein n=1 Tax=Auriscalpium vulgare TaxID=40419 RepID=A0ACB8R3Z2_9AGAM|nr:hypothetical protein FA95DRAFT_1585415 [Auriscalpium vulgare]